MMDAMSGAQFAEWVAFYNVEADDRRQAELAAEAEAKLRSRR